MPAAAPILCYAKMSRTGARRRGGGSMPAAAPMVRFLKCSRTGAKCRDSRDLTAAAPKENLEFEGYFTQSAAAVETWPPRRDVQTRFYCAFLSTELEGILGIFVPIGF